MQNFHSKLKQHQQQACVAMQAANRGQFLYPTGSGKTWVQVYSMLKEIDTATPGVVLMAAHRLLLCEQLLTQLLELAFHGEMNNRWEFNVLTVASGGLDEEDIARIECHNGNLLQRCIVKRSTTHQEIVNFAQKTAGMGRHLLIVSTYQSLDKVAGVPVSIACFDEAHTATEASKFSNLQKVLPSCAKAYYFTATQVVGCGGRGMDNVTVFGKTLGQMTPRKAIDLGLILPPLLHRVSVKGKAGNLTALKAAFKAHREKVLAVPANAGGILGPKLLVSAAGIEEIVGWATHKEFHKWAMESGIQVITFSSSFGYYVNGLDVTRKEALDKLQDLKDDESALILHYDILTEGIDLPNITGILPLRELDTVKFRQTCGRAARLFGQDRVLLERNPGAASKIVDGQVILSPLLVKPNFWVVVVPTLSKEVQAAETTQVTILREAYELDPVSREAPDVSTSSGTEEADSVIPRAQQTTSEASFRAEYSHEFEAYVFGGLADSEKERVLDGFLDQIEAEQKQEEENNGYNQEAESPDTEADAPLPPAVQERAPGRAPTGDSNFSHVYCGGLGRGGAAAQPLHDLARH